VKCSVVIVICTFCVHVLFSHVAGEESKMTDRQRDQIDADAELYIKTCVSAIKQLRTQGIGLCVSMCLPGLCSGYVVCGSD